MNTEAVAGFVRSLCHYAGEEEAFEKDFMERLAADEEICEEFSYYMEHGNFACKAKVFGYTVVDIMVWQIDHFKAWLDRDTVGTSQNPDRMILLSFDTLLKMKQNPQEYLKKLQGETGTDYPGKFF